MAWNVAWGTYANSGAPFDVGMVGGSGKVLGFPADKASRESGHGKGIQFTSLTNDGTKVRIELSLIGISLKKGKWIASNKTGYASPNGIIGSGWEYKWFIDIAYSTDKGKTYKNLKSNVLVATHRTPMALAFNTQSNIQSWKKANIEWKGEINLPKNFTHLRFEVKGEKPAQRHRNIYTREIVIPPTFKAWAIRKKDKFLSFDRKSGFFKIRHSGTWLDKSNALIDTIKQENKGTHRIRKEGKWLGQNRTGER